MSEILEFLRMYWKPVAEIFLFWMGYYAFLRFLRNTGGLIILRGLVLIFLFVILIRFLQLDTIAALVNEIIPLSVIALLIVFQNDLRRGLTRIGQSPVFKLLLKEKKLIDEIVKSVSVFSKRQIGALIAIEREMSLNPFSESGTLIDGLLTFELISTIFTPNTSLHDGGVIIQGSRIVSAGCLFPLSQNPGISKTLGTRHRAALGLSDETDAFVLVISEETGLISVAERGRLHQGMDAEELRKRLTTLYFPKRKASTRSRFSFSREVSKDEVEE